MIDLEPSRIVSGCLQDGATAEQGGPTGGAAATPGTSTWRGGGGGASGAPPSQHAQQEEWRATLLPALVAVLHQKRGQQMQECKEAAAAVLAKYASNGPLYAAAARSGGGAWLDTIRACSIQWWYDACGTWCCLVVTWFINPPGLACRMHHPPAARCCTGPLPCKLATHTGCSVLLPRCCSEAGALPPLVQLLFQGLQAAGGERRTAIAVLQALEPLVSGAECQKQLAGPCARCAAGRAGGG